MKITWLGQAGLYIETEGLKIIVDPYLSDSVVKVNPRNVFPSTSVFSPLSPTC